MERGGRYIGSCSEGPRKEGTIGMTNDYQILYSAFAWDSLSHNGLNDVVLGARPLA